MSGKTVEEQKVEEEMKATVETQTQDDTSKSSSNKMRRPVQRTGTVQRCFHRSTKSQGLSKRVTVFYEYNRDTKELKYGAVITPKSKHGTKKLSIEELEKSAKKRFERDPVVKHGFKDNTTSINEFEDTIRKLLITNGCKAHPNADQMNPVVTVVQSQMQQTQNPAA